MNNKFTELKKELSLMEKQGICLAFSGGIDSLLLLYLLKDLNPLAVTFQTVFHTEEEINFAIEFCKKYNINHKIIPVDVLNNEKIKNNPKDRCYQCKKVFFEKLKTAGDAKYFIDGTNFDDLNSTRPGLKAIKEFGIISPFAKHKITKQEIRDYAKNLGLKEYDKPSNPCIATRFPYNTQLTQEQIKIVKQGENVLKHYGFTNSRLRLHSNIARIEIEKNKFNDFLTKKDKIIIELKKLGINYITLDLEGIRTASMDV